MHNGWLVGWLVGAHHHDINKGPASLRGPERGGVPAVGSRTGAPRQRLGRVALDGRSRRDEGLETNERTNDGLF